MNRIRDGIASLTKKKPPVTDPVRDAEARFGVPFLVKREVSCWREEVSRHTTQEFARVGRGFRRHCGPTAITNLILTLHHRYRYLQAPLPAREIFVQVSGIGRKKKIYWNTDFLNHFGGTYDILTKVYIKDCLKHFGIPMAREKAGKEPAETGRNKHPVRIGSRFFASRKRALRALDEGKLLYLQLSHHPVYGSHHLLGCGYVVLQSVNGKYKERYMTLADGWSGEARYLRLSGLGVWHFLEVS